MRTHALVVASLASLAFSLAGAVAAIALGEASDFFGLRSGLSALADFAFGLGTALSPPLALLALQAVATWRAGAAWARRALLALGVAYVVGYVGERVVREALFGIRDPIVTTVAWGGLASAVALAWTAARAARRG